MKKEVLLFVVAALFLLAYILDYLSGSVGLSITHPIQLTNYTFFAPYPMTNFAILVRSIALMLTVVLFLSLMEYQYFKKLGISLFLGFIAFIYGYQQLITGGSITPLLWTIAITYGGVLLSIPAVVYLLLGIANFLVPPQKNTIILPKIDPQKPNESSVLNP